MQEILNIALFQFDIEWQDITSNLKKLDVFFDKIDRPVDVLVLPEMFTTGFTMHPENLAESFDGQTIRWMKSKAAQTDALIIGSFIFIEEDGQYYNRCVGVSPEGTISYQDKRHLFSYAGEDRVFSPAKERNLFEWRGWKLMCAVCYDLRFPVWTRNTNAYDLLIYVANWPELRIKAWNRLLKARAIENQCFVIGCNRVGVDGNGLKYIGSSAVLDFEADVLAHAVNNAGILYAKLSHKALEEYRAQYRFLHDMDDFEIKW